MQPQLPAGHTVRFTHLRFVPELGINMHPRTARAAGHHISPRGGETEARILDGAGNVLTVGRAFCCPRDNFNRRVGRAAALGRALAELTGEAERRRQRRLEREAARRHLRAA